MRASKRIKKIGEIKYGKMDEYLLMSLVDPFCSVAKIEMNEQRNGEIE